MNRTSLSVAAVLAALVATTAQPAEASLKGGVEAFLDGDYDLVVGEFKKVLKKKRKPEKAQLIMARMYLEGLGVPVNYSRAFQYLKPSADKKNAWAQYQIARLYAAGHGPVQSYHKANEYLLKSAKSGYAPAQLVLGKALLAGLGYAQPDRDQGYAWINLAATGLAGEARDEAIKLRDGTAAQMSAAAIARAQDQTLNWSEYIEFEIPEMVDLLRQARQKASAAAKDPKTKITLTMGGKTIEIKPKTIDTGKVATTENKQPLEAQVAADAAAAKKPAVKKTREQLIKETDEMMAAQRAAAEKAGKIKPRKKQSTATTPGATPGATAGQSAGAEEQGFFAVIVSSIGHVVGAVLGAIFGADEPATGPSNGTTVTSPPPPTKPAQ